MEERIAFAISPVSCRSSVPIEIQGVIFFEELQYSKWQFKFHFVYFTEHASHETTLTDKPTKSLLSRSQKHRFYFTVLLH